MTRLRRSFPTHARAGRRRLLSRPAAFVVSCALLAPALLPGVAHAAPDMDALCTSIAAVAGSEPRVTTGVVVLDLDSGARCAVNADRQYRTASLYKTIVAAELFRQVEAGTVTLEQPLTVEPRHAIDDPPELRPAAPYTVSVYTAAERMITFSDNATAFALRELLGLQTVDQATSWLGMNATTLANAFLTSPADQARLYTGIALGEFLPEEPTAGLLDLLLRQQIADLIPAALPEGAAVAHKTGTLDTYLHDAGIVYAPGGTFVLVIMTEHNSFDDALGVIRAVAAEAYTPYAEPPPPAEATPQPLATAAAVATSPSVLPLAEPATEGSDIPVAATGAPPPPALVLDERTDPLPLMEALSDPRVLAILLGLFALAALGPLALLRRRTTFRYGDSLAAGLSPADDAIRARADRSERGLVMRFGSRRDDDGRPATVSPASRSVAEVAEQPVLPSRRLQRVAEHFRAQSDLLATMRDQFEEEMEPLHELIVRQSRSMQSLLQNLEERLRPLNEYADGEEANLAALEERIQTGGGQDHVARTFATYLDEQRRRIEETRTQIDRQRVPFLEYGDAQRETVETALSHFDGDLDALEENLAEQRRVMIRMLDAMRSETFAAVRDYMDQRQRVLEDLAASGTTDPAEISRATQALRADLQDLAGKSDYVRALLDQAEIADRTLAAASPSPRPLRQEPPAPRRTISDARADDEPEEAEATA